jgi:hypothetical protein
VTEISKSEGTTNTSESAILEVRDSAGTGAFVLFGALVSILLGLVVLLSGYPSSDAATFFGIIPRPLVGLVMTVVGGWGTWRSVIASRGATRLELLETGVRWYPLRGGTPIEVPWESVRSLSSGTGGTLLFEFSDEVDPPKLRLDPSMVDKSALEIRQVVESKVERTLLAEIRDTRRLGHGDGT